MTDRAALERVMLEAMKPWRFGTMTSGGTCREFNVEREKLVSALDAAISAGWRFEPPQTVSRETGGSDA